MCAITSPIEQSAAKVLAGILTGDGELIDEHRRLGEFVVRPQTLFGSRSERNRASRFTPVPKHEYSARLNRGEQFVSRVWATPLVGANLAQPFCCLLPKGQQFGQVVRCCESDDHVFSLRPARSPIS
jgi:hypothetical protein